MSADAPIQPASAPRSESRTSLRVVVFEASRAGLEALKAVLAHVHTAERAAFIALAPADRERATALYDLLAQQSKLRWRSAEDGMLLEAATVYIVPPHKTAHIPADTLQLRELTASERAAPLDALLCSLADLSERCVALLLSGHGNDGCLGTRAVQAAGGCVLVEDPLIAAEPELPRALHSVLVPDHVGCASELGHKLDQLLRADASAQQASEQVPPHEHSQLLAALYDASGRDFAPYKRSLIWRRVRVRMQQLELNSAEAYIAWLRAHGDEAELLFEQLLIGVTGFFRDVEAFAELGRALERYLAHAGAARELRIWVPACSTGEEAYSIAIVAQEALERAQLRGSVQVFGTDLDRAAIEVARAGRYPLAARAEIGDERVARYFSAQGDSLQVGPALREQVVFAPHDVTRDPPFTQLDLLACRNLLIFLEPELQHKLLALFHYALVPEGLLFLGSAESSGALDDVFVALDDKWKIFRNRAARPLQHGERTLRKVAPSEANGSPSAGLPARTAERLLLDNLVPACALVDARGDILHVHGRTGRFLELAAGTLTPNVFELAREGLRLELPAAVREAVRQQRPVQRADLYVQTDAGREPVRLGVTPVVEAGKASGLVLITFETAPQSTRPAGHIACALAAGSDSHALAQRAQLELSQVREHLQRALDTLSATQRDPSTEPEKSYGQSDELESSRQELQSLNEELQTLNAELQDRNAELSLLRDDLHNLLHGSGLVALFLDSGLKLKRCSAEAAQLFRLSERDIDQPLADLTTHVRDESLVEHARRVLRTLATCEREVQTRDGSWHWLRIAPYRSARQAAAGLLITLRNIDSHKLHTRPSGVLVLDQELVVRAANPAFSRLFEVDPQRIVGQHLCELARACGKPRLSQQLRELASGRPFPALRVCAQPNEHGACESIVTALELTAAAELGRYVLLAHDVAMHEPSASVHAPPAG